jgi:hypothetical protein
MDIFLRNKHVYLLKYFCSGILTLFTYDVSKTVAETIRQKTNIINLSALVK